MKSVQGGDTFTADGPLSSCVGFKMSVWLKGAPVPPVQSDQEPRGAAQSDRSASAAAG